MPFVLLACLHLAAPTPSGAVVADLVELVDTAEQRNTLGQSHGGAFKVAGRRLLGIDQHPQHPGAGRSELAFEPIITPRPEAGERLLFVTEVAIREGFDPAANPAFDGVDFVVLANGREVLRERQREQAWRLVSCDLSALAGGPVQLTLITECGANSNYDWAVWGRPRVILDGRPAEATPGAAPYLRLADIRRPPPERIVEVHEGGAATTLVAVLDEHLDLATQTARLGGSVAPLVPLGPELVCGEGDDPENHTVVRILNRYQIARVQFLAYPPNVRGGVQVEAGRDEAGRTVIATAPIADDAAREIRLFDRDGGPVAEAIPSGVRPPYAILVGRVDADHDGDLLVVAERFARGRPHLNLFDLGGRLIRELDLGPEGDGELQLTSRRDGAFDALILWRPEARRGLLVRRGHTTEALAFDDLPAGARVYPSAAGDLVAVPPDADASLLRRPGAAPIDVAREEGRFWYVWPAAEKGWEELPPIPEGKHVRRCDYRHLRLDARPAAAREPDFANTDPSYWAGPEFVAGLERDRLLPDLDTVPPAIWEPCFTHRQFKGVFGRWHEALDPATGLPAYVMLSRRNRPVEYGEFGNIDFVASTYAPDVPALDRLYTLPLREFLRRLAPRFRARPERLVAIEPNHEHEIAVGIDHTIGDYNPHSVAGFYDYLARLHGDDVGRINEAMGTRFIDTFDAPRWAGRGAWDEYDEGNPFFWQWGLYNRYQINRRLADTFREALLAGYPPELIKSHQIPDLYAVGGGLAAFSDVADRITPIDYAMTAGVGFGFTRYGVWYQQAHQIGQAAYDSGFDLSLIGEYQALTPDADAAYAQLRWLFDHGVQQVHCMTWPQGHDKGFNRAMHQALARLAAEDPRRPGIAGGIGQVRAADGYDLVALGNGPARTGLIKSLQADGSFEGRVYVVPFHTHVAIEALPIDARAVPGGLLIGPIDDLDGGVQAEVTFTARAAAPGRLLFEVRRGQHGLPGLRRELYVGPTPRAYRLILRGQMPADGLTIALEPVAGDIELTAVAALRETDEVARIHRGRLDGRRHRGGVTFDTLPED